MAGVLDQDSSCKKRKNVDNNSYELIISLVLNDLSIETKEQCLGVSYQSVCEKIKGCSEENFNRYKEDIECRSPRIIKLYIYDFKKYILLPPFYTNEISAIYLEGKTITSSKILELNVDINHKYAKADIYVEFATKEIIGLSIKQNQNCTKGNYSVEKMVNECLITTDEVGNLSKMRKNVLKNAGFETHIKEQRKQVNKLFYPKETNDYWVQVKDYLTVYNEPIKKKLIEYLYPIHLPYVLYEFDGKELKELKIDTNDAVLQEHVEYYYTKKKLLRNAAKLFYQLKVNNQIYRVEIRWKGNIHSSSPQFQLHLVDE